MAGKLARKKKGRLFPLWQTKPHGYGPQQDVVCGSVLYPILDRGEIINKDIACMLIGEKVLNTIQP